MFEKFVNVLKVTHWKLANVALVQSVMRNEMTLWTRASYNVKFVIGPD